MLRFHRYIAAFGLDAGESAATIEKQLPPATTGIKATDDVYFYIDPAAFHADFAADVPPAKAEFMAQSQVLISADSFTHAVTTPACRFCANLPPGASSMWAVQPGLSP